MQASGTSYWRVIFSENRRPLFGSTRKKAATLNMVRRKGQCGQAQASPPDCVDCIDSTWKFVFYFCSFFADADAL
jgi:hypothetical protein